MIVFDIETGPLSDAEIKAMGEPFTPPVHPGEFCKLQVKLGNLKDETKIAAKVDAAKAAHEKQVAEYEADVARARGAHWEKETSKAALSSFTCRVLAIGYMSTDVGKTIIDIDDDESAMLRRFWEKYRQCKKQGRKLVGHNISRFDVKVLWQRSFKERLGTPESVLERGRWLDSTTFVDTMTRWGCGTGEPVKLGKLAKFFGVGGKPEGVDGSMFHELLKTDYPKAEAYLRNDLEMTAKVAERMGVA